MNAAQNPPKLFVRTVPLADRADSPVRRLPEAAPLAWLTEDEGLVGWGEAARMEPEVAPEGTAPTDNTRIGRAARWFGALLDNAEVEDEVRLPGTGPITFGTFTFAPTSPGSALVVPRVLVGRRAGRTWLTTITDTPGEDPEELLRPTTDPRPVGPLTWHPGSLSPAQWMDVIAGTVARIRAGELDKAVLARDAHAEAREPLDVRVLLERLRTRFPDCFTFSVDGMVGATPELLLRMEGSEFTSLVLAGTRPRGEDEESDRRLGREMMNAAKDVEEHGLAVDSLRTAMEPLAEELTVPSRPHLLRLANVQHLATRAHARLAPGVSALDAVAALHPTAAVGGTPTEAAMRHIARVEGMDRGGYAGPVGWLDGAGNAEWGIALRSARVDGHRARLYAGGGIVAGSDPEAELAETESKFRVMREALTDPED
ncbi:isochorismate synthase MenF [Nocardiopsis sp. MG754419]|uniref:isochorismate synthase n=1 Tax=Nocardiopsis sp. MG754419 TaxID=2259865 RepID=UPI001BAD9B51|nr:isochorismate synthase [Nocardiopsis sp. MG754419]MBR8740863.1 isochorismate synthase [Nocardiopsis sp. MG754419]